MRWSVEQTRMLADLGRRMDSGKQPFVVADGRRMMMMPIVIEELGLASGQTASSAIVIAILEAQMAASKGQDAIDRAQGARTMLDGIAKAMRAYGNEHGHYPSQIAIGPELEPVVLAEMNARRLGD